MLACRLHHLLWSSVNSGDVGGAVVQPLAARLRNLREQHWSGRPVLQWELAKALDVGNTTISSWESPTAPKIPPPLRLRQIATFFATRRSLDPPRLLADEELTAEERDRREALLAELDRLQSGRPGAVGAEAPRSPWHFPDGANVRIICGALDAADRPQFASGSNHNYMALSAFADLDALIELFGHVRTENPDSDVRYRLAGRLEHDDLQSHLVLLGNMAWVRTFLGELHLPVRQVGVAGLDGEVFEVLDDAGAVRQRHLPTLAGDDPRGQVTEDVGFFYRSPSPTSRLRTLTICSGVFTRGVYGAVRLLTDRNQDLHETNLAYLQKRFAGEERYGLLMRIAVHDHATATPDLREENIRLYEFP